MNVETHQGTRFRRVRFIPTVGEIGAKLVGVNPTLRDSGLENLRVLRAFVVNLLCGPRRTGDRTPMINVLARGLRNDPALLRPFAPSRLIPSPRAFSFVEILFAIMILGIGFIMIAAMFPVAIQQNQTTMELTMGRFVAEAGQRQVEAIIKSGMTPADSGGEIRYSSPSAAWVAATGYNTGDVVDFSGTLYQCILANTSDLTNQPPNATYWSSATPTSVFGQVQGNRICVADPRFAWVPFYSRDGAGPGTTAYIYILGLTSRSGSAYAYATIPTPYQTKVRLSNLASGDTIRIVPPGPGSPDVPMVADGAFVILKPRDNPTPSSPTPPSPGPPGPWSSTYFRLGANAGAVDLWYVDPGYDITPADDTSGTAVDAYVVGRQLSKLGQPYDPASNPFDTRVQDLVLLKTGVPLP